MENVCDTCKENVGGKVNWHEAVWFYLKQTKGEQRGSGLMAPNGKVCECVCGQDDRSVASATTASNVASSQCFCDDIRHPGHSDNQSNSGRWVTGNDTCCFCWFNSVSAQIWKQTYKYAVVDYQKLLMAPKNFWRQHENDGHPLWFNLFFATMFNFPLFDKLSTRS